MRELPKEIRGLGLLLRQPSEEMTESLLEFCPMQIPSKEAPLERLSFKAFKNKNELTHQLAQNACAGQAPSDYYYSTTQSPQTILGQVSISYLESDSPEIACCADINAPTAKGYASKALALLITAANKPTVIARIASHNSRSKGMVSRLGGKKTGWIKAQDNEIWSITMEALQANFPKM